MSINKLIMVSFQEGKRQEDGTKELIAFSQFQITTKNGEKDSLVIPRVCSKEEMDNYYETGYFDGNKAEGL